MNGKKYILWDWNGTILNDLDYNYNIINRLLANRNLQPVSIEEYRAVFCFPIKEFYKKIGFDCEYNEYYKLVAEYQEAYEKNIDKIKLTKGIYDTIETLHILGIKQIIFSSCNKLTIQHQLPLYDNLALYINEIIAQDNDFAVGKESLAINWGDKKKINWKDVMIIGDTYYDQEVADNLGCECILISSGHQWLKKEGNLFICDTAYEILDMIRKRYC